MMYFNWKTKGIKPSVFYTMGKGELTILQAFFEMEVDEEVRKREAMSKGGFCPAML